MFKKTGAKRIVEALSEFRKIAEHLIEGIQECHAERTVIDEQITTLKIRQVELGQVMDQGGRALAALNRLMGE